MPHNPRVLPAKAENFSQERLNHGHPDPGGIGLPFALLLGPSEGRGQGGGTAGVEGNDGLTKRRLGDFLVIQATTHIKEIMHSGYKGE